jgi:hypothetical protein
MPPDAALSSTASFDALLQLEEMGSGAADKSALMFSSEPQQS